MNMENEVAPTESGLIVHDRLPEGHPYRPHLEKALRRALSDLSGSWDVSIIPVGRRFYNIEVVAPDGSRWSTAVPVAEGPRAEDLAERVRAACARRWQATSPCGPSPVTDTPRPVPSPKASEPEPSALLEPAAGVRGRH
jgi:hypothetical protein